MGWGEKQGQGDLGVGVHATPPEGLALQLAAWQDAYDQLWHRARKFAGGLTAGLPTPHTLRTGQGPSDVMEALRQGHELDVDDDTEERA